MNISSQSWNEQDEREIRNHVPHIKLEKIDGVNFWIEWREDNGKMYQLLYYLGYDSEYRAEVVQGLENLANFTRRISSDGIIDIQSSYKDPCPGVLEARERAFTVLRSIGEITKMSEQGKMRIMTLGFSNAGKTAFLGSLGKLSFDYLKFSLQAEDYITSDEISNLYRILSGVKKNAVVPSTVKLRPHEMVLNQGAKLVLRTEITDIEGQALEPDRNRGIAEQIAQQIGRYDGLILFLEAPKTLAESVQRKWELSRMLLFASEVLKRNRSIPMTLVLTKIDELPNSETIVNQLRGEVENFEDNLTKKYKNNFKEKKQQRSAQKGFIVNKYVRQLIDTESIFDVYDSFFNFLRSNDMDIPNKVFPVTSLGFNSVYNNKMKADELQVGRGAYEPYGTAAAFLWTIYARVAGQTQDNITGISEGIILEQFQDDILDDIRVLYTSGQAFFWADEDSQNGIWDLRNISNLRTDQIDD